MPLELEVQFEIVFYALAAGFILGIFFDIYRILRGKKGHKIIVMIQDILFWILSALAIFTFLLYTNFAFLGPYVYLCMGVSLLIYLKLFSKAIYKLENIIFFGTKTIVRRSYKNASYPLRIIWSKINNKN
ncbi:spore cortex biosynthesis protein YabQ [Clostridium sardiniense]|uniref:spore cortex biosynthesis protein YabQ n=1 Tax=Clostridium sardiniense TaxID=29369 RepID=UPI00195EDB97|nr:spore cortex biosynthesis protein YabQ [Clostridium sardiniense]MBM7833931.1 spore cortex biosynthesis protein YabQ [Clostridium sardiniense]